MPEVRVKRAEELRRCLKEQRITAEGLERSIAVILTYIERAVKADDPDSLKTIAGLAANPEGYIELLGMAAANNGEVE
ncbi:hypothetical protein V4V35_23825 [Bacillus infantis]|uniref:hypothetical protein n=1 Tax=Bacillus infantis TaxID=324767 RepID=UPI002FBE389F